MVFQTGTVVREESNQQNSRGPWFVHLLPCPLRVAFLPRMHAISPILYGHSPLGRSRLPPFNNYPSSSGFQPYLYKFNDHLVNGHPFPILDCTESTTGINHCIFTQIAQCTRLETTAVTELSCSLCAMRRTTSHRRQRRVRVARRFSATISHDILAVQDAIKLVDVDSEEGPF